MSRWIAILVAALALGACRDSPPSTTHVEPTPKCLAHAALNEIGCLYEATDLARQTGRDTYPVWVYHGILQKHGDGYLLQVTRESDAAFMVLDVTSIPESETRLGLDPLIGWQTRVIGRYTSSDVVEPSVPGASGTLRAVSIGHIRDPARPQGPYSDATAD